MPSWLGPKLLILPDDIRVDAALKARLEAYRARGGRLLLTGESGLAQGEDRFALDVGAEFAGVSENQPDYLECDGPLSPSFVANPLVNIHLQGRFDTYPKRRGITRVKEMLEANINVCFGHDDVFDPCSWVGERSKTRIASVGNTMPSPRPPAAHAT